MAKKFDYSGAKQAGYSDEEITSFLSEQNPKFDVQSALSAGYSPEEVSSFLSQPSTSKMQKAGRTATQFGIGLAEGATIPYNIATAPLASKEAQNVGYRENVAEDIENLLMQKQSGDWSPQDEQLLQSLKEQMASPRKSMEFAKTADISVPGALEKATGVGAPEGVLEHAARWTGLIKNPKKIIDLTQGGLKSLSSPDKAKTILKAITPTASESARGLGAGVFLEAAKEGDLGPIGEMAATVIGDIVGGGALGGVKGLGKAIASPKQTLATAIAKITKKDALDVQKQIIDEFRKNNIQADLGSITDSNLVKWMQSKISQSGLVGKELDAFKKNMSNQIVNDYKKVADEVGNIKFQTQHEAGELLQNTIRKMRDTDLSKARKMYQNAMGRLKDDSIVSGNRLIRSIEALEGKLSPGSLKSGESTSVLNVLEKIKNDIHYGPEGTPVFRAKDLINNKINLNSIIDYEVQGGQKQLLKDIVKEIDRSVLQHGSKDPIFAKNFILANKNFSQHAKTFRNKAMGQALKEEDPARLMKKMDTVQGIRQVGKILSKSPEGMQLFKDLKRAKLEEAIGNKLVDSTTHQVKLGTFSKLSEKGKGREILREILGKEGFARLERLQKNAGRLSEAAEKYYNASKSGSTAVDAAALLTAVGSIATALTGNFWPLIKAGTGFAAVKGTAKLLTDKTFLRLVEDAILASQKNNMPMLQRSMQAMKPYVLPAAEQLTQGIKSQE